MDPFEKGIWVVTFCMVLIISLLAFMDATVWSPKREAIRLECTNKGGIMIPTRQYDSKGGPTYGDYKCFRNLEEVK
jgi:hypothetical protein